MQENVRALRTSVHVGQRSRGDHAPPKAVARPGPTINVALSDFSELLHLLYLGATEAVPWQGFLTKVGAALSANWVSLVLRQPSADRYGLILTWREGFPVRIATDYNQYAYAIDPFVHLPLDQVLSIDEVIDGEELRRGEFYKQFLAPANIGLMLGFDFHATGQVNTGYSNNIACHFRVCRPADAPPFSDADRVLLKTLLPHLKLAVHWHSQNDVMVTERELYAGTVDRMLVGMVVLDENGANIKTTPAALEILKEADGISLAEGGLKLAYEQENRKLQRQLVDALSVAKHRKTSIAEAMAVTRPSGRGNLGLVVRAVPHNTWSEGKRRPTVAVMIRDPERKAEGSHETLRNLYELTRAESALALKLANGLTLEEASDALEIRKNTARAHLRAIFSKTGVTRQTMLVRLILGSLSMG